MGNNNSNIDIRKKLSLRKFSVFASVIVLFIISYLIYGKINLTHKFTISGIVADLNGKPVKGIWVYTSQRVGKSNVEEFQKVFTSENGKFKFRFNTNNNVSIDVVSHTGRWRVRASRRWVKPNLYNLKFIAIRETGNENDFASVTKNVIIKGRVLDSEEKPVSDANVYGSTSYERTSSNTNEEGIFAINLPITIGWNNAIPYSVSLGLYIDSKENKIGGIYLMAFP